LSKLHTGNQSKLSIVQKTQFIIHHHITYYVLSNMERHSIDYKQNCSISSLITIIS